MRQNRILIVEDDPNSASYLYNQLIALGYKRIDFAVNSADAIELVKENTPDIIFMDLFLRGSKNGIDTAREILKSATIPIIFVTGSTNFYLIEEAGFKEQPGFISKPFTIEDIRISLKVLENPKLTDTPELKEAERLKALGRYNIVNTPREKPFDTITAIAAKIFNVPIAVVTFVDRDKIWFKSRYGFSKSQIPKSVSLFAHTFLPDTFFDSSIKSPVTARNPIFAEEYNFSFYACAPLLTPEGHSLGSICVMDTKPRSITTAEKDLLSQLGSLVMDQMEMRRTMIEAYKRRREFVSTAVHNLKNPLTSVMGFSDILNSELSVKQRELNGYIKVSAQNMLAIVDNLQQTSLLDLKQVKLSCVPVRFEDILDNAVATNQAHAFRKKQTFSKRIYGDPIVRVDTLRIGEALDNLISNAIKYSAYDSSIELSAKSEADKVIFEIRDHGPGVSEEKIENIFEKFSDQDARPTGDEGSTGLGLAITKNLVEMHGGKISAESKGLGKGTTFKIELPSISESELHDYEHIEKRDLANST